MQEWTNVPLCYAPTSVFCTRPTSVTTSRLLWSERRVLLLHTLTGRMAVVASTFAESTDLSSGPTTVTISSTRVSSMSVSELSSAGPPLSKETSAASSLVPQVSSSRGHSSTTQHATFSTSIISSTATPSLASSTATSDASSSNGLSYTDEIGIAAACIGVFIGLLAGIYQSWRFSKRKRIRRSGLVRSRSASTGASILPLTAPQDVRPNREPDIEEYLPIPKADRELASELQSLCHLIQQHVENHYHGEPKFTSTGLINQALVDLGFDDECAKELPGAAQLANMAANPSIRPITLQHIITRVIFMSLSINSESNVSLLPSAIVDLVRDMPPIEKHVGNPEGKSILLHAQVCLCAANWHSSVLLVARSLATTMCLPLELKAQRARGPST